jgi:hypothetical protein
MKPIAILPVAKAFRIAPTKGLSASRSRRLAKKSLIQGKTTVHVEKYTVHGNHKPFSTRDKPIYITMRFRRKTSRTKVALPGS